MFSAQRCSQLTVSATTLLVLVGMADAVFAGFDDLVPAKKMPGIYTKVIVSEDEAKLFRDGPGEGDGETVEAFSIFFKLYADTAARKETLGGYVRVGDGDGMEIGWISENAVIEWNTRFLLEPIIPDPTKPGAAFRVISPGASVTYIGQPGGDKQKVAVPILGRVGEGANPDYPVAYFAGTLRAVVAGKASVGAPAPTSSNQRKAEIMFVIDTTANMTPLIEITKEVVRKIAADLEGQPGVAKAMRFGLVQFRDLTDGITFSGEPARLETKLTDVRTFQEKVNSLSVTALSSGETKEDVLAGLLMAIEKAGWSENSTKHIILLGDASTHRSGPKNSTGLSIHKIIRKAQTDAGSELDSHLRTINFHAVRAKSIDVVDGKLCRAQFNTLAENAGKFSGYYTEFDPSVSGSREKQVDELSEFLGGFVANTAKAQAGDLEGLAEDAKGGDPASIPAKALYKIELVSGDPPIKVIERGIAKLKSKDGYLLARQMVLVSELDLRRLRSTLDLLLLQLRNKSDPARIDNIGQLLERLQETLVVLVTGQDLRDDKHLGDVIAGLPLSTEVLKLSRKDLASMTKSDFKEWLTGLEGARKRAASLLEDEKTLWYQLPEEVENEKFAFIRLEDLP